MVDPVSIGLTLAAGAAKGIAGMNAGQQNKRALFGQAREELIAGNEQQLRIRDAARIAMGEQVAAQSSNGFFGGTGSAIDALRESQINAALDALTVRREAEAKARSLRAQGRQASQQGKFALVESIIGTGSQLLGQKSDWAAARSGQRPAPSPKAGGI
jgi:hypothetical protein